MYVLKKEETYLLTSDSNVVVQMLLGENKAKYFQVIWDSPGTTDFVMRKHIFFHRVLFCITFQMIVILLSLFILFVVVFNGFQGFWTVTYTAQHYITVLNAAPGDRRSRGDTF